MWKQGHELYGSLYKVNVSFFFNLILVIILLSTLLSEPKMLKTSIFKKRVIKYAYNSKSLEILIYKTSIANQLVLTCHVTLQYY